MPGVVDTTDVIPGLSVWTNPGNKFRVAKLHYTADPAKRTPAWKESAKQGMPDRGWAREYELSFEAPLGQAVIPEFSAANIKAIQPSHGRILRGWDFGALSPAIVFAQLDLYGRKLILGELVLQQTTLGQLIDAVRARTIELFGRPGECFDAGDPAGEAFLDLGQVRAVLLRAGIQLHTGRNKESYDDLRKEFLRQVYVPGEGVTSAILMHPRCTTLIEACQGAFHYSDRPTMKEPKPVPSHPYKDIVDALRYLNDNLSVATTDHVEQMKKVAAADIVW